jgi:hypothetical protein
MSFDTPILLLAFNRPKHLAKVIERLKEIRPTRVLAVIDGARPQILGEADKVAEVKDLILSAFGHAAFESDFSPTNLGCKNRVSSGISWAFERVDRAIILEDDCLPDPSFFRFCEEMLMRFENNPKVFQVGANNFFPDDTVSSESYFFSRFAYIWGWATWRRAWKYYDVHMHQWRQKNKIARATWGPWWQDVFDRVSNGKIDTWDYQWQYVLQKCGGLSVVPTKNLVSNIGFGPEATHTIEYRKDLADAATSSLHFPLVHPSRIVANEAYDKKVAARLFDPHAWEGVARPVKTFLKQL